MIPVYYQKTNKNKYFIGALSGTSMDSINTILMDYSHKRPEIIATSKYPFNKLIVKKLLQIMQVKNCNLEDLGTIDHQIGILFAKAIHKLLIKANFSYNAINAIGFHGQTIWHAPDNQYPFTIQLGDPNIVCARTKIITIADFRRKDLANQGQGAPLAPLFHAKVFRNKYKNRAIINLGGIANITILPKNYRTPILGFDIGPGNCLMDEWVQTKCVHLNLQYDQNGHLASQGTVISSLLNVCLKDPYFHKKLPKSTGREYFNLKWLQKKILLCRTKKYYYQDILATLSMLTAKIIHIEIEKIGNIEEIYLCGGGTNNLHLLTNIQEQVNCPVYTTKKLGIAPDWVEAALFAWLAKQTYELKAVNLMSITGCKNTQILGGTYFPD